MRKHRKTQREDHEQNWTVLPDTKQMGSHAEQERQGERVPKAQPGRLWIVSVHGDELSDLTTGWGSRKANPH